MLTVLNYEIKNKWLYFYKKWKYNYKYISFRNSEGWYMLSDNIIDTSKHNFRTWNPKFEYKNLIKNIKK
jgi:hypothetical protein